MHWFGLTLVDICDLFKSLMGIAYERNHMYELRLQGSN